MQSAVLTRNGRFFSKTQISTPNSLRPMKKHLSTQNNQKHSLGQKKLFLILDLLQKRIFNKNWLIFSKTQVSTQNGVRTSKTLLSTQKNEKESFGQKTPFST